MSHVVMVGQLARCAGAGCIINTRACREKCVEGGHGDMEIWSERQISL